MNNFALVKLYRQNMIREGQLNFRSNWFLFLFTFRKISRTLQNLASLKQFQKKFEFFLLDWFDCLIDAFLFDDDFEAIRSD